MKIIENEWIPMPDGVKLAAKIWLPDEAESKPVPAILEYIPYRKRDSKAQRDMQTFGFFAENGYAGVRVDIRGSGDSEGILYDEYLQQELDDGLAILKWMARQDWCDGNIGMMGISWGGFNGLQIAALQPPELKAVITVASSDHRYQDDVHYMGGCLLSDNLSWASTMFSYNACPPDPAIAGDQWRQMWLDRLNGSGLWLKKWLEHQRLDDYWKHASVCTDYSAIQCPVFALSGWADGYSNTVFRLLENLDVPTKGLVGAWGHKYPHLGGPGPVIDFLGECVLWWDRWLKGEQNGIDQEPNLRVWMQGPTNPITAHRPGEWIGEHQWPAPDLEDKTYHLRFGLLDDSGEVGHAAPIDLQSSLSTGLFAGKWCSYSETTDLPQDQREDDGGSLVFDTMPLEEDVEILGAPTVKLRLSVDKPVAMISARLNDVSPNGRATRATYGILNLTHRNSDEEPEALEPGKEYEIELSLNYIAQKFVKGNKIRLSLSTSYWPLAWPPPEPVKMTFYLDDCYLHLPVRHPKQLDEELREFEHPEFQHHVAKTVHQPAHREWTVKHNIATNQVSLDVIDNDADVTLEDINLRYDADSEEQYSFWNDNYETVRGEVTSERSFQRGNWQTVIKNKTILTSTKSHFIIRATLDAYEGDVRVFSKSWDERIERDFM